MIDEPVPTMPLRVPATSPTARTKRKFKVLFPANRKHRRWSAAKSGNKFEADPGLRCAPSGLNDRYSRNTLTCHTRESGRFINGSSASRGEGAKSYLQ